MPTVFGLQADEQRQQDHAPAQHPDHAGEHEVREVQVERPEEANQRQLQDDEQRAAPDEESPKSGRVRERAAVQKRAGPGEECERRRAEVRDPPREEDRRRGAAGRHAGIDADVIDRHQDHDDAAHDVDGLESRRSALGHAAEHGSR